MINSRDTTLKWLNIFALTLLLLGGVVDLSAQVKRSAKSTIRGGMIVAPTKPDSTSMAMLPDSVRVDSVAIDSLKSYAIESLGVDSLAADSIAMVLGGDVMQNPQDVSLEEVNAAMLNSIPQTQPLAEVPKERQKFFSDSMSLSKMCWISTVLPGYGQVYNKQLWKLPIIYGAMGASIALFVNENKRYQPLKSEWESLTYTNLNRDDQIDAVQHDMIRSNTRRQIYLGLAISSYIYSLGDAAVCYSTNDVSSVKKATTLAMICPGAGQIYNGSYWKLPFVVGGFATMIYVIDWNSRGYTRFKKAYALRYDYDVNPDNYENGSEDEFGGRYTADYLKSLRNSYRRNRDLCIIMTAGLYILQIIDAHVDAHLRDYDISDDLSMNVEPLIQSNYAPQLGRSVGTYGFNFNMTF